MEKINFFDPLSQQREALSPSFSLNTLCRWLTVGDSILCPGLTTSLSTDSKTYILLTSVHNDADDTDATDNADTADDYNMVIGIAQLKAFSCAKSGKLGFFMSLFRNCHTHDMFTCPKFSP